MEIKISRSARGCAQCGVEFVHEQPLHSVVCYGEEGLLRADYCMQCWNKEKSKAAFSAWLTRYDDPRVAEQQPAEVFSPLRRLFYEACASEERTELAKAYLAAQLLKRQKAFRQIKESDETEGEIRITLYADRIGNRIIEVRDPSFSYAELDAARTSLLKRLRELEEKGDDATPAKEEATASPEVSTPPETLPLVDENPPSDEAPVVVEEGPDTVLCPD